MESQNQQFRDSALAYNTGVYGTYQFLSGRPTRDTDFDSQLIRTDGAHYENDGGARPVALHRRRDALVGAYLWGDSAAELGLQPTPVERSLRELHGQGYTFHATRYIEPTITPFQAWDFLRQGEERDTEDYQG